MKAAVSFFILLSGSFLQVWGQGLINNGATITIASGAYLSCQGALANSGTVTNSGTLGLTGGLTNTGTVEGDGLYHIGGNWINDGSFEHGSGTVVFDGTELQIIVAPFLTVFNNLIFDAASAGTTIAAGARVTVEGDIFSPNGKLTVNSDELNNNGSLIYYGQGVPSGNLTYNRLLRQDEVAETYEDRHFFSSPVGGLTFPDFISANSSKINMSGSVYQIWEWNEVPGDWPIVSSGSFVSGKGYNVDQAAGSDGLLNFSGSVVSSATFTATSPYETGYVARASLADYHENAQWSGTRSWDNYGGGGWNLMGNPFPSAMDASAFITGNPLKFDPHYQALYLYDGVNDVYLWAAVSVPGYPQSGEYGRYVQAGQGFFVLALYDNIVFNFNSAMQSHQTNTAMLKSAASETPWSGLDLKVVYDGGKESRTMVVYNSEMTAGNDPGYDVGQMSTGPDVEIYTALVSKDNDINFTRQALPAEGATDITVPIGIDSEKGGDVIFSAYTVKLGSNRFWLEDRVNGTFTDLTTKSYKVTLPAKTYGTGRFFIIASANMPTGNEELTADDEAGLRIWGYDRKVIIKGEVTEAAVCEIFDIGGRKLLSKRMAGGELNTVDLPEGLHGVILIRVTDKGRVTTRRLAVL